MVVAVVTALLAPAACSKANPDIQVQLDLVPYASYFTNLPLDVSGGNADDIYWLNTSDFGAFADAGRLVDVGAAFPDEKAGWLPAANAARDLQAIYYPFVGSNGGTVQAPDDTFTFTTPTPISAATSSCRARWRCSSRAPTTRATPTARARTPR